MARSLVVKDAHEHNLKHVSVTLPRDAIVVVTGVSGSGKSSLAFDTIFQEGQRRFVDSLSAYARRFIGSMKRPEVESVRGISPTISIDQKTVNRNPRSTVGTTVEILDYYRLLFARLGEPHCPKCGKKIEAQTPDQIVDNLYAMSEGRSLIVLAPIVQERKGEYRKEFADLAQKGFSRVRVDGALYRIQEVPALVRYEKHTIEVVMDRVMLERKNVSRVREAIESALRLTDGKLVAFLLDEKDYVLQGTELACVNCRVSIPELEPRFFSFNDYQGRCPVCKGLGRLYQFDPALMVNPELSIEDGALLCQKKDNRSGNMMFTDFGWRELREIAHTANFSLSTPWKDLPEFARNAVLYGTPATGRGIVPILQELWDRWHIVHFKKFMHDEICPECKGSRLHPVANAVQFHGYGIQTMCDWSVNRSEKFFRELELTSHEDRIGREIFKEIRNRLGFLKSVGLGYLTLSRGAATLSGGEAQRIRLAAAVGAGLQGVLYVLDEPSIGLHARDNEMLLSILERLRSQGNSLIVVEHDEETMRYADCVVDIGPGAGIEGGKVIAMGTVEDLKKNPKSLTGLYLSGARKIEIPEVRKPVTPETHFLKIFGAAENNLKNIDVQIPLDGTLTVVTGVSGSGKSTLVNQILRRELARRFYGAEDVPGKFNRIEGLEFIDKVIEIDQTPIGRTPRSNPATYTKIFDDIRDLFASLPESKARGYSKSRFSFNVRGGRCEACEGAGVNEVEMQILPNVQVTCEACDGKRFNDATLEIHYRGLTITDVLNLTVEDACKFFENIPRIAEPLALLKEVGLGYLTLGQPSTTLSGGEAQRIKIATELRRPGTGHTLYLLDEPTTGLHFEDIRRLLDCLARLRKLGNSMVIIEHNLDVVKCADWIIDLGPEAGEGGGRIVATGTPEVIAADKNSITGKFLAEMLAPRRNVTQIKRIPPDENFSLDIEVAGARKHNLKNFNVTIPRHKMTVITGVSGSGKSSLAFHTLFAEGQRRFVETLSTYARRFLGRLDRGSVDSIHGLAPAIAIDQGSTSRSPRSTVATLTEIYDYFRILWARAGEAHCIHCGRKIESGDVSSVVRSTLSEYAKKEITVLAPVWISGSNKTWMATSADKVKLLSDRLCEMGYRKVFLDGAFADLPLRNSTAKAREVYAAVDYLSVSEKNANRLGEAVERAYRDGNGVLGILLEGKPVRTYSEAPGCPDCHWYMDRVLDPKCFSFNTHWGACETCYGLGVTDDGEVCPDCGGERLKPEYRSVKINGLSIVEACDKSIDGAREWFSKLEFKAGAATVAKPLLLEILGRLDFLKSVGLGYIGLSRTGDTLSGGESQRIRLASQIGSGLTGVMYVLDEPTVGLHQSDTHRLIESLYRLRDLGNTLVVVEHDMEMMRAADHILDLGPGAGEFGGEIVAEGTPKELSRKAALKAFPRSETVKYLTGSVPLYNPEDSSPVEKTAPFLKFSHLKNHNLKDISVRIPENRITTVCGVSGSGKSSLVMGEIYPLMHDAFGRGDKRKKARARADFPESVKSVELVTQEPISGTPRSTPASYTGVLDSIRKLFAKMDLSKMKGYDVGRFSYNSAKGRCPKCEGRGAISVEMHFLSDVWEVCDECKGRRYNKETLAVEFKGKNIADVLDMPITEACEFFKDQEKIYRPLSVLAEVGLGYLRLGQSVTTLSGGEAQRLKLASELASTRNSGVLYLLDEPTTGLHLKDIQLLWNLLRRLSARGNTVVVIEHQPDVIRLSDWIVELGPKGGGGGGFLLYEGVPRSE